MLVVTKGVGNSPCGDDRCQRMLYFIIDVWCPETKQGYPIYVQSWLYNNAEQIANEIYQLACKYKGWEHSKLVSFLLNHPDFKEE